MKIEIKILDAVECELSKHDGEILLPCLSFNAYYWKQGPHKRQKVKYKKDVYSFKGRGKNPVYRFYTGLLPRILKWCEDNNIKVNLVGDEFIIEPQNEPHLKGITFREDQLEMINAAISKQRGNLIAPTQTGKTLIFLGILSCYPKANILILSHTTTITKQTYDRLLKYEFTDVELFGGGNVISHPSKRITVSTIQSFASLDPKVYSDYYDICIIDEQHRVSKMKSQYADVLSKLLAPIRLGFSATPKEGDKEAMFTSEGLIGPIISRLSIEEATQLNILQKPRIELINTVMPRGIGSVYKYQDTYEKINKYEIECHFTSKDNEMFTVEAEKKEDAFNTIHEELKNENILINEYKLEYKNHTPINGKRISIGAYSAGVVENVERTNQISDLVKEKLENNKIIFLFVTYTLHGKLIQEAIKEKMGISVPFIEGSTPSKERDKVKEGLRNKKIKVCIAGNAWAEGLTVGTITDLLLCGSGRSELQLLQKAGRVLANDNVIITHFLDSKNKHLALHSLEILSVFVKKGWI